jgi:hypothetical protein
LTAIDKSRASLDEARRRRLNHPGSIWWAWKRATKPAAGSLRHVAERSRHDAKGLKANARAVFWPHEMLRRAAEGMREGRSNDFLVLATVALRSAIRGQDDLAALLEEPLPRPLSRARAAEERPIA